MNTCYLIRSCKSILMIQIDWIELSLLSNKTRLVLFEIAADHLQHERRRRLVSDATIINNIDINTCRLLRFEGESEAVEYLLPSFDFDAITWAKSRSKYVDIHLSFSNHRWCLHRWTMKRTRENRRNLITTKEKKNSERENERNNVCLILRFFFHLTLDYDYVTDINS